METYKVIRHYFLEIKKYKWLFLWMLLGIAVAKVSEAFQPLIMKYIVDIIAWETLTVSYSIMELFYFLVLIEVVWWIGWRLLDFLIVPFQLKSMKHISERCFKTLQMQSFRFYSENFAWSIVKKINRFVYAYEWVTDVFVFEFYNVVLKLTLSLSIIFIYKPFFWWVLALWSFFTIVVSYYIWRWKLQFDKLAAEQDSKVSWYLADAITNYDTVKSFWNERYEQKWFRNVLATWYKHSFFAWNLHVIINTLQFASLITIQLLFIYFAIVWWQSWMFTAWDFIFLQWYLNILFSTLWNFTNVVKRFYRCIADASEMVEILDQEPEIQDVPNASRLSVPSWMIEFRNVSFWYIEKWWDLFQNFNLSIKPWEKVAIVWESWSGKTTLIKILSRFYDVQKWWIYIDNQNIKEVTQESLHKNISLVPQDPSLFHRTLSENISYWNMKATENDIVDASKKANAFDFINGLSDKFNTLVWERWVKLSWWQRQRVAIARAILEDSKILVFDEATSSLDSVTETEIQNAMENAMKWKTVIVIAHRLSTIKQADRVIVMHEWKIVEEGSHTALIKKKWQYANLWNHQVWWFLQE